jgi:NAD(P) transhydrogenase
MAQASCAHTQIFLDLNNPSLRVGYAGVDNDLFFYENNAMYLGDAKQMTEKLVELLGTGPNKKEGESDTHVSDIEAPSEKTNAEDDFSTKIPELIGQAFLKVGVIKEVDDGERKVAIVPEGAKRLLQSGIQVLVERGAGTGGDFYDKCYEEVGTTVLGSAEEVFEQADIIVKIREPTVHPSTFKNEIEMIPKGKSLICFLGPRTDKGQELMEIAKKAGVNLLAVDAIPRISRAQSLDVLSSQAMIAGYHSIVVAANAFQKFLNGETTAAGSFPPSKILVVGAGVAGMFIMILLKHCPGSGFVTRSNRVHS